MLVPTVELREGESGRYVLEAVVAAAIVARIGSPTPPERCEVGEPEQDDDDEDIRMRYPIHCEGEPLTPRDVLVLPWAVDGIQLTAFWSDGTSRRALFGRDHAGVVVRLHLIMDREESIAYRVKELGIAGWRHFWTSGTHLVLLLALTLVVRGTWIGLGGLVTGHALALILADVGAIGLPRVPADAAFAGAAALLMAALVSPNRFDGDRVGRRGIFAVTTLLGVLHGLGMATELADSGVAGAGLVTALFIFNCGLDSGAVVFTLAALFAWKIAGPGLESRRELIAGLIGIAGMFLLFALMREGLTPTASTSAGESGFMEVDALAERAPLSAARLAPPPSQLDATGQLTAPFMSYLIVEPYQIRHEVLLDVKDVGEWIDIPLDAAAQIPIDSQKQLTRHLVTLVSERAAVAVDGELARVASGRADFVLLGATGALTRETPIPETLSTAIVGVTLVFETESIADSVALDWGLFSDAVTTVPFTLTDPVAIAESKLTPAAPRFEWRNTLGDFELPKIEAIAATKARVPLVSFVLGGVGLAAFLVTRKRAAGVVCLAAAYVLYPFARVEASIPFVPFIGKLRIDRAEAAKVIEGLLTNVYRCFDIHNEDLIYDRLALTVTGEQLLEVYLESRRALEIDNRGGARVRIDEVVVREVREIRETGNGGFELDTRWTVGGSVNHFGHIHFRQNQYDATIEIAPVDGTWKIRGLELMEEKRVL